MSRHLSTNSTITEEEPIFPDASRAIRLPTKARIALTCVYLSQLFGSFAVTVIQYYLYFTCKDLLGYDEHYALIITLVFGSVTYVSSIVGGVVADVKLGCYQVTFMACCLLMLGQTVAYIIYVFHDAYKTLPNLIRAFHMIGIILVAVGQGLWNVALIPLGRRHVYNQNTDPDLCRRRQHSYLRWFCFFYALGVFFSIIYLSVSFDVSRAVKVFGASLPLWATGITTFITIIGKRFYLPDYLPLGKRKLQRFIRALLLKYKGLSMETNQILLLRLFGLKLVAFSILSAYLAIYFQADSSYMDQLRKLTNSTNNVDVHPMPRQNMAIYHPLFVMVTILAGSLYGRFTTPCLHWYKVCIGIFLGACSVACAFAVQTSIVNADDLNYHWLIPQYGFLGIAEAFYFVGGNEMCYALSIKGLETLSLGMFYGGGSLFGVLLYATFVASSSHWHSIFKAMFATLLALALVTLFLFMFIISRCMKTREDLVDDDPEQTEASDDSEPRSSAWLEDSSEWDSSAQDRPLRPRIWENF